MYLFVETYVFHIKVSSCWTCLFDTSRKHIAIYKLTSTVGLCTYIIFSDDAYVKIGLHTSYQYIFIPITAVNQSVSRKILKLMFSVCPCDRGHSDVWIKCFIINDMSR